MLAVLVASLLAIGPGDYQSPQSAVAAGGPGCLKIWHKKRAMKYVKRPNGWTKVAYWKRWWTCDPYEPSGPSRLGVEATEFSFGLSRPAVRAGNVIIQLNNRGADAHNLRVARTSDNRSIGAISDTASRQTRTGAFRLKPGLYTLSCTLFRHAELGMRVRLRVLRRGG